MKLKNTEHDTAPSSIVPVGTLYSLPCISIEYQWYPVITHSRHIPIPVYSRGSPPTHGCMLSRTSGRNTGSVDTAMWPHCLDEET